MTKKKNTQKQQKLSPARYIKLKAKNLPFHECLINIDWQEKGMASLLVSKKMPSGNFIVGIYNIDVYCLGIKNATYKFNFDEYEYKELVEHMESSGELLECELKFAHNLIYGAIDFAEELGFKPHKDFEIPEYILNQDLVDDGINEIEFGRDGVPYYVAGPFDNPKQIIATLNRTVGEGNYKYIRPQDNY